MEHWVKPEHKTNDGHCCELERCLTAKNLEIHQDILEMEDPCPDRMAQWLARTPVVQFDLLDVMDAIPEISWPDITVEGKYAYIPVSCTIDPIDKISTVKFAYRIVDVDYLHIALDQLAIGTGTRQ